MNKPIQYSSRFAKHFRSRISPYPKISNQTRKSIKQFLCNPGLVKDHALIGRKVGKRAFSVSGDVRIVYVDLGDRYLFLDIGTHNQVY
jgi:mRNA-degrading endonuclease YafQ of YafQ-DinJ toxin-antitoxin module